MSFSRKYHPNNTTPAPVRIECLVQKHATLPDTYTYTYVITVLGERGPTEHGASGAVKAQDQDNAEAQVYGELIDDLATELANWVTRSQEREEQRKKGTDRCTHAGAIACGCPGRIGW